MQMLIFDIKAQTAFLQSRFQNPTHNLNLSLSHWGAASVCDFFIICPAQLYAAVPDFKSLSAGLNILESGLKLVLFVKFVFKISFGLPLFIRFVVDPKGGTQLAVSTAPTETALELLLHKSRQKLTNQMERHKKRPVIYVSHCSTLEYNG